MDAVKCCEHDVFPNKTHGGAFLFKGSKLVSSGWCVGNVAGN